MTMRGKVGFTLIEVLVTLTVLSIGALAIMQYSKQAQDTTAEITHLDTMSRLASLQMQKLEKEDFSSSFSREGEYEDYPGYSWEAQSHLLKSGGWYRMELTVRRKDSGRTVVVERIFREKL